MVLTKIVEMGCLGLMQIKKYFIFLISISTIVCNCKSVNYDLVITKQENIENLSFEQNQMIVENVEFGFYVRNEAFERNKLKNHLNKNIIQTRIDISNIEKKKILLNKFKHEYNIIPHYFVLTLLTGGLYAIFGGPILKENLNTVWVISNSKNDRKKDVEFTCSKNHSIYDRKISIEVNTEQYNLEYGDFCRNDILEKIKDEIISNF